MALALLAGPAAAWQEGAAEDSAAAPAAAQEAPDPETTPAEAPAPEASAPDAAATGAGDEAARGRQQEWLQNRNQRLRERAEAEATAAAPAADGAPADAAPRDARVDPAHQRFCDTLKDILGHELEVQAFEWSQPLAKEKVRDLTGHRRKRRLRLTEDKLGFRDNARQIPLQPLVLPAPNQAGTNRQVLSLLSRLRRAYDESRDTRPLTLWREANEKFVATADWAQRDRAVNYRDEVIQRELDYVRLAAQASELVDGAAGRELIEEMTVTLDAISPDTAETGGDLSMLTLFNETVRGQVLSEIVAVLQTPVEMWDEAPEEEELEHDLDALRAQLYTASGVDQIALERLKLQPEIDKVNERLEGPEDIEPAQRELLVKRRTDLVNQLAALDRKWTNTRPDKELAADLIAAQDAAIRRSLLDAGYHGALYAKRVEHMDTLAWRVEGGTLTVWEFLDAQERLLDDILDAVPEGSPMQGVDPPPSPSQLAATNMLIQRANAHISRAVQQSKQSAASQGKPPVGSMGGGKGGGGKGGGMGAGGQPLIPKPIQGGSKGKKKGKKGWP